jgi:hypothetical protein
MCGAHERQASVDDDVFTGYLTRKWTSGVPGLIVENDDQLTATATLLEQSLSHITSPAAGEATLTADDGILVTSETVLLTCDVPS